MGKTGNTVHEGPKVLSKGRREEIERALVKAHVERIVLNAFEEWVIHGMAAVDNIDVVIEWRSSRRLCINVLVLLLMVVLDARGK